MTKNQVGVSISNRRLRTWVPAALALAIGAGMVSCAANRPRDNGDARPLESATAQAVPDAGRPVATTLPAPLSQPVPLWQDGKVSKQIDAATASANGYLVIDLGNEWTPYILSEHENPSEPVVANPFRATYLQYARAQFPTGPEFARVRRDKYLELYGIMPTLTLLRSRFEEMKRLDCDVKVDLSALSQYRGIVGYTDNSRARKDASRFAFLEKRLETILVKQQVDDIAQLDKKRLSPGDQGVLKQYEKFGPAGKAVRAAQERLKCEGYYEGKGRVVEGALDWSTNEALAEFERRHRVFGWGFLGRETLATLQTPGLELERQAVVRVLVERAMHAGGFLEDGSVSDGKPVTFQGADGKDHPVPDLEKDVRDIVVKAFGLDTPEHALAWLQGQGDVPSQRFVAIERPAIPEYYSESMPLSVSIDRGDVWYEFPYDEQGKERAQPVKRRPHITVSLDYRGKSIPLVRYNTTIGGWRSENIDGSVMWKYKNSPVGPRMWHEIVAAPVWLPPPGTPAKDLLKPVPGKTGQDAFKINYDEIGPGYSSAYGLVAAYHLRYQKKDDGTIEFGGDEGIRTHGSVDYMSILERHSHGCHRLYNHLAVRLMSFVLAHRPHHRRGQQRLAFKMPLKQDDLDYTVEVEKGGYVFELDEPVPVEVLKGNIRGSRKTPIETPIPKYDDKIGAYVMPDGSAVKVDRSGNMTPTELPAAATDGGAPADPNADAGVMQPAAQVP